MNTYKEEISKWLYICLACLNCRVLMIAFLWSQLILQTSILRAIELSMFLTELMYVLISFNCWLIRLRWGLKWNSLLGNLHINQILVDHSNNPGCVIFGDVWLWNIVNTDMNTVANAADFSACFVGQSHLLDSTVHPVLFQTTSDRLTSLQPNNSKPMCLFVL